MKVSFGMYWQTYGRQIMEIPEMPEEDVIDYIRDHWGEIPIPVGDFVTGSDELDEESLEIYKVI